MIPAVFGPAVNLGGDTWLATIDLDDIPDDGEYDVSVDAIDGFGYAGASRTRSS